VVDFFCLEVEPCLGRARVVVLCLELEEPLPDLLLDLLESDFCLDLFPEDQKLGFVESSPFHPVLGIDSLDEFQSPMRCSAFHGGPYHLDMLASPL